MKLSERIEAFSELGERIAAQKENLIDLCGNNSWFTPDNVSFALDSLRQNLSKKALETWTATYRFPQNHTPKRIGVITAGNIPLVEFHDFLSVLISGNFFLGKLSSKNDTLLPAIIKILIQIDPRFDSYIELTDSLLHNFDAVIATGSNNSARYFDFYFKDYPHIIRKNRNSLALLTGKENSTDLQNLANDIFLYFGLGCRNVSKIYVPSGYNFTPLLESFEKFAPLLHHHKYANNYNYQKALLLMNQLPFTDNGFLLIKEDTSLSSPVSVLHFEYFENTEQVVQKIDNQRESIQCISCLNQDLYPGSIPLGEAQKPTLTDYADGIDTLSFCLS